jgi:ribonuclease J
MDHSAFDAYAFLISAGGKHLFYTGDFRSHGRKANTIVRLMKNPPNVDVMIIEGTMLGPRSDERCLSEENLEEEIFLAIKETAGIVLVTAASQNIDRMVSIYKAAKRAHRCLVIDFYTAEILERLGKYAKLPQATWPGIRVCYPQRLEGWFELLGLDDILQRHRRNGISWRAIRETEDKSVMLIRPGYLVDIKKHLALVGATWIYSMWPGYIDRGNAFDGLLAYLKEKGARIEFLHTGGHATLPDLIKLVEAIKPREVIPIHSFHPDRFKADLTNVRIVSDGELVLI